ncbi:MAG: thioredoxin family protein [Bacteroidetes bacterium]|nr:thioredoxin family protein [Bacteroidota bacterium]
MKVEVFTAGCQFCSSVETQVREVVTDKHEVVVYNLNDESSSSEYFERAKNYGVNSVPSVVVNEELLNCCSRKGFDPGILSRALS